MLYFRSHHPQLVCIFLSLSFSLCPFFLSLFALPVSSQSCSAFSICPLASLLYFLSSTLLYFSSLSIPLLCLVLWLCCCWVGLCFYQMSAVVHCGFTKAFW